MRAVYISVYPHYALVCCMRSGPSWQRPRWCFLPVKSVQLFSRWRMRFVCCVRVFVYPSVLEWVCLSPSVCCVCVCVMASLCANVCVCFPSSTLTSLNSWLSLSSHSRGRLFSQLLAAIQCGSITDAAINTRGHGMHSITDIIETDSIRLDL